ncbi:glutamate decarboxylase 1-like, partial [Micropterus salmoides]
MDFLQLPDRIIDTPSVKDKEQEDSAAVRGQTPPDFSSIYSKDLLPASRGEEMTRRFLQELVNILLSYISKSNQRSSKVLDFHHPHQLKEGLEGFSLDLPEQPETLEQILVDCRDTLKYGVST